MHRGRQRHYEYFERELAHLRSAAREFADEFPKVGVGRLGLDREPCPDPYVERLLEGFAYLAARVQLKIDAEFPRFTQNLLETVYPHYLAPTPSMLVARFHPDRAQPALASGHLIPRGTALRGHVGKGERTACEYRTGAPLTLWPIEAEEARYYGSEVRVLGLEAFAGPLARTRSAVRLRLRALADLSFDAINLDTLRLFVGGLGSVGGRLYAGLLGRCCGVVVRAAGDEPDVGAAPPAARVRPAGFDAAEALIPYDERSFQGYRLLHEYFAFPQRFMFVELTGLRAGLARCKTQAVDLIIAMDAEDPALEGAVDASCLTPGCVPAVNLFPRRADRIFVSERSSEFHVMVDRTRPADFEVYRVLGVTGYEAGGQETAFRPFYSSLDQDSDAASGAYFSAYRTPRVVSEQEKRSGRRSTYAGSEVYVSLVDASSAPCSMDLKQLGVETLCSNRDLPLLMPLGLGATDFTLEIGAPVSSVRVVAGPTPPRASHAEGEISWRLISHLSLNHLSLSDGADRAGSGAVALREMLRLYSDWSDPAVRKQVEGVRSVRPAQVVRRVPTPGPIAFARGLEVAVTLDESSFEGVGCFLLGKVLEQFFARYVSLNSFTETVVRSTERGEIMRWSARVGQRPIF
ncbi:MAG: type VI secretion system baseplate subunit TssF [Phycisphaerae bacterium]|nr:type VI secretion system baseplate subunit TssF [Phycisphaerae bacterium]